MRKKLIAVGVAVVIIAALAGATLWLFVSGKVVFVDSDAEVTDSYTAVCDTDIVDRYNEAMIFTERDDSGELSLDEAALRTLQNEISRTAETDNDPTCQTILFWIAVSNENYENAKTAYEKVKALHEKRLFADSNLIGNQALSAYEGVVYTLSPEGQESEGIRD